MSMTLYQQKLPPRLSLLLVVTPDHFDKLINLNHQLHNNYKTQFGSAVGLCSLRLSKNESQITCSYVAKKKPYERLRNAS